MTRWASPRLGGRLWLGGGQFAFEEQMPGPGDQVDASRREFEPGLVDREHTGRDRPKPVSLPVRMQSSGHRDTQHRRSAGPLDADADRPALRPLTMADVLELPVLAAGQPKVVRGHARLSRPAQPAGRFSTSVLRISAMPPPRAHLLNQRPARCRWRVKGRCRCTKK